MATKPISDDEFKRRAAEVTEEARTAFRDALIDIATGESVKALNRETTISKLVHKGWTHAEAEAIHDAPLNSPLAEITLASPVKHFL